VLYNAAALGIVLDVEANTQTFFNLHEDDITAIDLNPVDKMTVATGELGAKPSIYVWNAETKEVRCKFKGVLTKGVVCLSFTPSGNRLVGGGIDVDHTLAVFDVTGAGSVVWKDKGGPDVIIDIRCNDENTFTTIGVKHYYVWVLNGAAIKKTKGTFGTKSCNKLSGIALSGGDTICGAADGSVQVWKGTTISKEFEKMHTLPCDCITTTKEYVLSGGRDGRIVVFDKSYNKLTEIDCAKLFGDNCMHPGVRAIDIHPSEPRMLVGTLGSDIYEVSFNGKIGANT
jgi:microtubule-associated protein-like 6